MDSFTDVHEKSINGVISTFDRLIFKGHLGALFPDAALKRYLWRRGVLLKDAGKFFEAKTQRIKDHVASIAERYRRCRVPERQAVPALRVVDIIARRSGNRRAA